MYSLYGTFVEIYEKKDQVSWCHLLIITNEDDFDKF
jgi:hypothetical protein